MSGIAGEGVLILTAEPGDSGAQRIHGVTVRWQALNQVNKTRLKVAQGAFFGAKFFQLGGVRKLSAPQQIGDFFECAFFRQFLHGISAVGQGVGFGNDFGDRGVVDNYPVEAFIDLLVSGGSVWCSHDGVLSGFPMRGRSPAWDLLPQYGVFAATGWCRVKLGGVECVR